jgi:hypothetical protein
LFQVKIKANNFNNRFSDDFEVKVSEGLMDINTDLESIIMVFKKALLGLGFHQSIVDRVVVIPIDVNMEEVIDEDSDDENLLN